MTDVDSAKTFKKYMQILIPKITEKLLKRNHFILLLLSKEKSNPHSTKKLAARFLQGFMQGLKILQKYFNDVAGT